jgi:CheY-like chemotaxis protein
MPGRDGFDLLDQIRSWGTEPGGDVPVIVTTGLRDPDLESVTDLALPQGEILCSPKEPSSNLEMRQEQLGKPF